MRLQISNISINEETKYVQFDCIINGNIQKVYEIHINLADLYIDVSDTLGIIEIIESNANSDTLREIVRDDVLLTRAYGS